MSTRDFRTWGRAILNNTLLDRATTNRWLKPVALTSQWTTAVGAPFEIYRMQFPANSIIGSERIIDTYCKQGDVEMYSTYFAVVPDLEIGMSVLTAGEHPNRQIAPVRNTAVEIFVGACALYCSVFVELPCTILLTAMAYQVPCSRCGGQGTGRPGIHGQV